MKHSTKHNWDQFCFDTSTARVYKIVHQTFIAICLSQNNRNLYYNPFYSNELLFVKYFLSIFKPKK